MPSFFDLFVRSVYSFVKYVIRRGYHLSENEQIKKIEVKEVMKDSYVRYAMMTIESRALPDVRDGLKPVQRRSIYGMHELKLGAGNPKKKSARAIGHIMGVYHPHGDSSIYEAVVRMTQDFSLLFPLMDGQGNFGSIDGDGAAAMRYTEVQLSEMGDLILKDIDKNVVDFIPNYDGSTKEPIALPSRFPNMIVNGTGGIAVGISTSIMPHSLQETVNAVIHFFKNGDITHEEVFEIMKGPDFPTGGILMGTKGIEESFRTGVGRIVLRGRVHVEQEKKHTNIVITEIPYRTKKPAILEKIASMVESETLKNVTDIRDESDRRNGMRMVIEFQKDTDVNEVIPLLYSGTKLESAFSVQNLALVDGVPKLLSMREMIIHYAEHQREVVRRRTIYSLESLERRQKILEAYIIVSENVDRVVEIVKTSKTPLAARKTLQQEFSISEMQAQAILDLRFQRITGIEVTKIRQELKAIVKEIKHLKSLLKKPALLDGVIIEELEEIVRTHGKPRRTTIVEVDENLKNFGVVETHEILKKEFALIQTAKGGVGIVEKDQMETVLARLKKERDSILIHRIVPEGETFRAVTSDGRLSKVTWNELFRPKGILEPIETLTTPAGNVVSLLPNDGKDVLLVTKKGMVKRMAADEVTLSTRNGSALIRLKDDAVVQALTLKEEDTLVLLSTDGYQMMIQSKNIPVQGKSAAGVIGMKCTKDATVLLAFRQGTVKLRGRSIKGLAQGTTRRGTKGIVLSDKALDLSLFVGVRDEG